jgi:hypothetical protein
MATIQLEAQVTPEELLRAAAQLGSAELERFAERVFSLVAHRRAPSLSAEETELLQAINQGLPAALRERYEALLARRRDETLTPEEHEELIALTFEVEALGVRRVDHLDALARLRGVSVTELLDSLGMRTPEYE